MDQRTIDLMSFGVAISKGGQRVDPQDFYIDPVGDAAKALGATRADIPGLWNAPGYPELTTGQLLDIAAALTPARS